MRFRFWIIWTIFLFGIGGGLTQGCRGAAEQNTDDRAIVFGAEGRGPGVGELEAVGNRIKMLNAKRASREWLEIEDRLEQLALRFPDERQVYVTWGDLYFRAVKSPDAAVYWGGIEKARQLAIDKYERAIAYDPTSLLIYQRLIRCYLGYDQRQAQAVMERMRRLGLNKLEIDFIEGKSYFELKQYDRAESILLAVLREAEEKLQFFEMRNAEDLLGQLYLKTGDYQKAEKYLLRAVRGYRGRAAEKYLGWACPYQALGALYAATDRTKQAIKNYIIAAEIDANNSRIQYEVAAVLFDAGDYRNALKYLNRAIAMSDVPEYRKLRQPLLWRVLCAGIASHSWPEFDPSWLAAPPVSSSLHEIVKQYESGDLSGALLALTRQSEQLDPARRLTMEGFILLRQRQYQPAREAFHGALVANWGAQGGLVGLAHLDIVDQSYPRASDRLSQVLSAHQSDPAFRKRTIAADRPYDWMVHKMALLGMGWILANTNRHAPALNYFEKVLWYQPNDLLALLGKGNSLVGIGKYDRAGAVFARVLEQEPGNPYALAELGNIALQRKEYQLAERRYRQALAAEPTKYTCPYEGLGLLHLARGDLEKAKNYFGKAIRINPNIEYKKFNGLAKIYIKEGKYGEAKKLLLKSLKNNPHGEEAKMLLGQLNVLPNSGS